MNEMRPPKAYGRDTASIHIRLSCDTAGAPFAMNPFEITTTGMVRDMPDALNLFYFEVLPDAMFPIQTRIEINSERVKASREFPLNTTIVFEKNKVYQSSYEMPFGFCSTRILTDSIEVTRKNGAGSALISFQIGVGDIMLHYKYDIRYSKG